MGRPANKAEKVVAKTSAINSDKSGQIDEPISLTEKEKEYIYIYCEVVSFSGWLIKCSVAVVVSWKLAIFLSPPVGNLQQSQGPKRRAGVQSTISSTARRLIILAVCQQPADASHQRFRSTLFRCAMYQPSYWLSFWEQLSGRRIRGTCNYTLEKTVRHS